MAQYQRARTIRDERQLMGYSPPQQNSLQRTRRYQPVLFARQDVQGYGTYRTRRARVSRVHR